MLMGQHHGLQARTADLVDGHRGHCLRQAALDHRLARRVLADACGQHLAEDDLADLLTGHAGALQQALDDGGAQHGGRRGGQRAPELADGSACRGDDDDVRGHGFVSS